MKSLKESVQVKLGDFGIITSEKEPCTECDYRYATRTIITYNDGTTSSHCKYCEDKKLAERLGLPKSKEESKSRKIIARSRHFTRIPQDLKHAKLNDYNDKTKEQEDAKKLAIDFITGFDKKKSLVFSGDPGIGKSHIAVAITNALSKDYSTLFLKSTNLLDLIKDSYNGASHSEMDVLKICADVDLLVIDDLGAEYAKEGDSESWASDIIYKVIDSRLGKSLIVTTNYSESLLEKKYGFNGKRITSRMSDGAAKIRIIGNDRRKS